MSFACVSIFENADDVSNACVSVAEASVSTPEDAAMAGFSIEFCTAVAVVVTGVTLIYMAKKVLYIMHVERRHM